MTVPLSIMILFATIILMLYKKIPPSCESNIPKNVILNITAYRFPWKGRDGVVVEHTLLISYIFFYSIGKVIPTITNKKAKIKEIFLAYILNFIFTPLII